MNVLTASPMGHMRNWWPIKLELMVVATPSNLHAAQTIAAMRAGQHVIVEKPMASDLAGADAMLAVAKETGRTLTVHQNLRYAADFVKVREVIASGVLGRIIEIRIHNGGFDRRWDWQTMKRYGGGALNNSGPHFIDMGMLLIDDPEPTVFCHMETTPLYAGDADSHVKVVLKPNPEQGPLVEINITTACAFPQPNFLVLGTQGSLVCDRDEARWRYFDPAEAPPLILDEAPIARDRTYNREQLPWKEERAPSSTTARAVYRRSIAPSTPPSATAQSWTLAPRAYAPRSRYWKSAANSTPIVSEASEEGNLLPASHGLHASIVGMSPALSIFASSWSHLGSTLAPLHSFRHKGVSYGTELHVRNASPLGTG